MKFLALFVIALAVVAVNGHQNPVMNFGHPQWSPLMPVANQQTWSWMPQTWEHKNWVHPMTSTHIKPMGWEHEKTYAWTPINSDLAWNDGKTFVWTPMSHDQSWAHKNVAFEPVTIHQQNQWKNLAWEPRLTQDHHWDHNQAKMWQNQWQAPGFTGIVQPNVHWTTQQKIMEPTPIINHHQTWTSPVAMQDQAWTPQGKTFAWAPATTMLGGLGHWNWK
ncbi:c4b-binding protein beta chain [Sarcoptes scabiei]|nr:c4b-binding protein beta chain [Sarcoptes scabiei]